MYTIATLADIGTSIGTLSLAFVTVCTLREMRTQMTWDRTYRPRLDAYTRFMEAKSIQGDIAYRTDMIVPQLDFIQPYSSNEVKTKAKELYKNWNDYKDRETLENLINVQLEPIIRSEIEDITKAKKKSWWQLWK
jgi:thiaminase